MKTILWLLTALILSCVETVTVEPNPDATQYPTDANTDSTTDSTSESIPWNDATTEDAQTLDTSIPDVNVILGEDVAPDAQPLDATPDITSLDAPADITTLDASTIPPTDATDATTQDAIADRTDNMRDVLIDAGPDSGLPTCPFQRGTHSWTLWKIGPSTLVDLGDGTFFDVRTCLRWEKSITSASTTYTAAEFSERCKNPSLPGTGWRRPTRIELESLVDYSEMSPSMWTFNAPYERFWTSSMTTGAMGWTVLFYNGEVATRSISSKYYGRCVSGNGDGELPADPPNGHYSIEGNVVHDNDTGLTWQKGDSQALNPAPLNISTARSWCTGSGMRLPSLAELQSIIYDYHTPAVVTAVFPSTASAIYWTDTPYAGTGHLPWRVDLTDGSTVLGTSADDVAFAKCVQ